MRSSLDLSGDHVQLNGQTFSNGFEGLRALADKDRDDVTRRCRGPWDADLDQNKIEIWIDAKRNGVAEPAELSLLAEAGVVAINPCNVC